MEYGLIGEHLSHSYSCQIHSVIADYTYELRELKPTELDGFFHTRDFRAINVTIPYKQAVIPYLDFISDEARRIGAVNTVVNRDGRLYGYNTDLAGMRSLAQRIGIEGKGKKVLIFGTGGTSKTARVLAEDMGASQILNVSRSPSDDSISYADAARDHADAGIIINTTPAGMYPHIDTQAASLKPFYKLEAVLDAVYNPLRSNLILEAQGRGIACEGGLYMLSAQAVAASALFTGRELNADDTERAYRHVLDSKRNIILIGMPSCGKTGVGKVLSALTGRKFADTDELILREIGMSISDYFGKYGERAFRDIESTVIKRLSEENGIIIATGGGAVLREENVRTLKRNGILIFLDRAPEKLIATADRPLSRDRKKLLQLYWDRYAIYRAAADVRVDGNGSMEETARLVYGEVKR